MATIKITKENFEKEILKSDIPIIIDFWASWCGPCQMMGPIFEELSGEYEGKLKFAKISTEEEPELAEHFQIQGIPALSIVKRNKEFGRIVGFKPKDSLRKEIESALGRVE